MTCPHASMSPATEPAMAAAVEHAVRACPFLHAVAGAQGPAAARRLACPVSGGDGAGPAHPSAGASLAATYARVHGGPGALVPLNKGAGRCPFAAAAAASGTAATVRLPQGTAAEARPVAGDFHLAGTVGGGCPLAVRAAARQAAAGAAVENSTPAPSSARAPPEDGALARRPSTTLAVSTAPFASMSLPFLGGLPDPADFFKRARAARKVRQQQQQQHNQGQQKPRPPRAGGPPGGGGGAPPTTTSTSGAGRPPPLPPRRRPGPVNPRAVTSSSSSASMPLRGGSSSAGGCPLRGIPVVGALIPLAANGVDLACPPAILALRAAVARVPAVRALRPRPLLARGAVVAGVGAAAAAPFGAWRVHLEKFSPGWFVAVHATVPFVAALRQATAMPRWALVLTLAGSVAGQLIGGAVERARLAALAEESRLAEAGTAAPSPGRTFFLRNKPVVLGSPCRSATGRRAGDRGRERAPSVVVA